MEEGNGHDRTWQKFGSVKLRGCSQSPGAKCSALRGCPICPERNFQVMRGAMGRMRKAGDRVFRGKPEFPAIWAVVAISAGKKDTAFHNPTLAIFARLFKSARGAREGVTRCDTRAKGGVSPCPAAPQSASLSVQG